MKQLSKLQIYLFAALIFILPFDIKTLIYQSEWHGGIFNPYTSIWISLSELLLYLNALLFLVTSLRKRKKISTGDDSFFLVILLSFFSAIFSLVISKYDDQLLKFFIGLKLFDLLIFYMLAVNRVLKMTQIMKIFIYSMGLQALIGISQFILQSDLGLSFLGETDLSRFNPLAAKFYFKEIPILRAYGTFAHPNIFAAYLLTSIMFILIFWSKFKHFQKYILLILQTTALLLTFSRSGLFASIVSLIILGSWHLKYLQIRRRIKVLLLTLLLLSQILFLWIYRILSIFTDNSIGERLEGYKNALLMFLDRPMGVGFGLSTLYLDEISDAAILPWNYQPTHNIFLLVMSEAGVLGIAVILSSLGFVIYKLVMKNMRLMHVKERHIWRIFSCILLSFILIGSVDHYFFTLEKGRYLTLLNFAMFSIFLTSKGNIFPIKKEG